jgi:MFS family permease
MIGPGADHQKGISMAEEADASRAKPAAWYALAVLAIVSFFAFLDRQILVLLAEPIRRDLGLSDLQLGMIQGFGVALFAALAGYPLGWAADRFDRRKVLAACIVWWSLAVVGCAMANSFLALLISGAMVGAGEAGLAPVMYALIPIFFIGRQRQIANSIAAIASVGGGALAFGAAGAIISLVAGYHQRLPEWLRGLEEWRLSLLAAALLAPVMIALVLSIRTPCHVGDAVSVGAAAAPSATATKSYFWRHRNAYLRFYIGGAMGSFAFLALAVWSSVAATRVFAQEPADVGAAFGVAQIASAASGFLLSLLVVRVWGARLGPALPVRMMWVGTLLAAVVLLTLPLAASAAHLFIIYGVAGIFLTFAAMAFPTALQSISPPHLRGRVASIQFIASMLIASGAPPLVGLVSDALSDRPDGVLLAITLVAVPALAAGALLLRSCEGRTLAALLEDAGESSALDFASLRSEAATAC